MEVKHGALWIVRWEFYESPRSMVRGMCRVQLKDRKRTKDLMLNLNKTLDLFTMGNSVHWHGFVSRREDGHVLSRALDFEAEGQRRNGRQEIAMKN